MKKGSPADFSFIIWVRIRALVHATESLDRIQAALLNFFQFSEKTVSLNINRMEGTFHNPIHAITLKIKKKREIARFLTQIREYLASSDKKIFRREFSLRLDENLVFRFKIDKDGLVLDKLYLSRGNPILIELRVQKPFKPVDDLGHYIEQQFTRTGLLE